MVKESLRGEFPILWFLKDLDILGILWGKLLLHFLHSLGQGDGKGEFLDVGMTFS